jgi:hypothetical protein
MILLSYINFKRVSIQCGALNKIEFILFRLSGLELEVLEEVLSATNKGGLGDNPSTQVQ